MNEKLPNMQTLVNRIPVTGLTCIIYKQNQYGVTLYFT